MIYKFRKVWRGYLWIMFNWYYRRTFNLVVPEVTLPIPKDVKHREDELNYRMINKAQSFYPHFWILANVVSLLWSFLFKQNPHAMFTTCQALLRVLCKYTLSTPKPLFYMMLKLPFIWKTVKTVKALFSHFAVSRTKLEANLHWWCWFSLILESPVLLLVHIHSIVTIDDF